MNPLSKAYQCRPKNGEAKPEKQRAHNSTLAAPSKPMNKVGKRGRGLKLMDSECADLVMERDNWECQACFLIYGSRVPANVVHHIARKNTHRGVERRFEVGYQVALCSLCHGDEHAQRGFSHRLVITTEELPDGRIMQKFWREGLSGLKSTAKFVSNYNPFAGDAE